MNCMVDTPEGKAEPMPVTYTVLALFKQQRLRSLPLLPL